jgi:hypothetical protein
MNDNTWLANLKKGDKVFVKYGGYGNPEYHLKNVDKITPTGKIRVAGVLYGTDGYRKAGGWSYDNLVQYTTEREDKFKQKALKSKMCNCLKNIDWFGLSDEKISTVYDLVKE